MIFRKIGSLFCSYVRSFLLIPIAIIRFIYDFFYFNKANKKNNQYLPMPIKGIIPMLLDRYKDAGTIDRHYFLQDIYVASKIIEKQPKEHYDVGSRVDGFISILLAALKGEITIIDIRPLPIQIDKLNFICADATNLSNLEDGSLESLSSLHAIEHFGLGRYGDQIMPHACYTAMRSLQRVVKGGGYLYFSVPIGKHDAVYFNSHRIFRPSTILRIFDKMDLLEFSYIHNYNIKTIKGDEAKSLIQSGNIPIEDYDCGIFIFERL